VQRRCRELAGPESKGRHAGDTDCCAQHGVRPCEAKQSIQPRCNPRQPCLQAVSCHRCAKWQVAAAAPAGRCRTDVVRCVGGRQQPRPSPLLPLLSLPLLLLCSPC
jgi:hypothetical protein